MGTVPVLKPSEVCRKGRDIAPSLPRQIARDIGLNIEELLQNR